MITKRTWITPLDLPVPEELRSLLDAHPFVLQRLARLGLTDPMSAKAFLYPVNYSATPPQSLPDLEIAVERLLAAIQRGECICVWGDFDVDGQTATTILVATLKQLGANIIYHIPVRENESHGVNLPILTQLIEGGVKLLLTCDTGISAIEAVAYARQHGIGAIITDHHELPEELPKADAIINPKSLASNHPLATLPGVGVAYKLAEAIFDAVGRPDEAEQFLDLVALGIIADVAYQQGDTRYLLQRGLACLRETSRLGLQMIMEIAQVDRDSLTEEHVGYLLAPRLNALGRLGDANPIVELLLTANAARARVLALRLEGWNEQRKLLTNQMLRGALTQIDADPTLLNTPVLVLTHPSWSAGVLGIVASRLVERFAKPVVMISAQPGMLARGSARSVEGVNITAAIASQKEMLAGFGGHPMAAGLTLPAGDDIEERIAKFRRGLARTVLEMVGTQPAYGQLQIDGYMPLSSLTIDFVAELEKLAPFGAGNPPLTLVSKSMFIVHHRSLGRNDEHLLVTVADKQGTTSRLVWWQGADWDIPEGSFDLAYHVRLSSSTEETGLQVEWVDYQLLEQGLEVRDTSKSLQVLDYRKEKNPLEVLRSLQERIEDLQIWAEAAELSGLVIKDRFELIPGNELAIWSTPPGPDELYDAIKIVKPKVVYLFAINPEMDQPESFLKRLMGLVKHCLRNYNGQVEIQRLAVATAQEVRVVWKGLAWLEAKGIIQILNKEGESVWLRQGSGHPNLELQSLTQQLKALLNETDSYRNYFHRASMDALQIALSYKSN